MIDATDTLRQDDLAARVDEAAARLAAEAFGRLSFPSGDLVDAAASLYPTPARRQSVAWQQVAPALYSETAAGLSEGSWPVLDIAPGLLRFRRRDASARERARTRELARGDRAYLARARELEALREPMVWFEPIDGRKVVDRSRAAITEWSRRSQSNLIQAILSLDLAAMLDAGRAPAMVTLTLPGRWLDVAPDGDVARRLFRKFRHRWSRKWGRPAWIWKREFQDRGAPHWHVWLVPPTDDLAGFKVWLSETWTDCLAIADPEERARSLRAGTNLSIAEGLRARDPKRLALYFLKESGAAAVKAYQNRVPMEWAGEFVGRFWGVAGLRKVVGTVEISPELQDAIWRVMRRVREASAGTRTVEVERVNARTGVVRRRRVKRRVKIRAAAGWVAVNDGPAFASQIARYLALLDPPR